jgi:tetratricopeptide (TPR) repeat protein
MATIAEAVAQARQLHQAGDLVRAESLCRQILQANPAHGEVHFLLGQVCRQCHRVGEAIAQYREAIRLQPKQGVAYLHLADTLQRQGDLSGAEECLRRSLIEISPFPEGHYNLGNVLWAQGRIAEATTQYEDTLRLRPHFPQAHNNLGILLLAVENGEEAAAHFEQALRLQPRYVEARYNLGNALRELQQVGQAIQAYQQALALDPRYAPAHDSLAEAFLEMGDASQAQAHWRQALRLDPGDIRALLGLAANGLYSETEPGIDQIETGLQNSRLSLDTASHLHFTVGYLLDRTGATDRAFDHFRLGNEQRRELFRQSGTAFDPRKHSQRIDQLIAAYSEEFFRRTQGFGHSSDLPVFIVGMPRSGTTLVEQILSNHSQVYGAGELKEVSRIVAQLPGQLTAGKDYPECLAHVDAATINGLAQTHLRGLSRRGGPATRVIDKMIENVLHLGLIAALFPRARVIHCRRDPLDVCVSCYFQFFKGLNFAWDLDDLGQYYRDYERLMAHWKAVLPLPIHEVVYEDLVADLEGVSRRLVEFCGLSWEDSCLKFHENRRAVQTMSKVQVRQPIYTTSVGRWRRYATHLGPLQRALSSQTHSTSTDPQG